MKGKPINLETLTKGLNEFRITSGKKQFERKELLQKLEEIGFNKCIAAYAAAKLFKTEKIGTSKLYQFGENPIHKSQISGLYVHYRGTKNDYTARQREKKSSCLSAVNDSLANEKAMIEYLKSKGYQIRKPVGFDEQKFAQMNPELYSRFIKYETL